MSSIRDIGWLHGHRSALYWLAMVYRRPKMVKDQLRALGSSRDCLALGVQLYWHALPYVILCILAGRLARFGIAHLSYPSVLAWHFLWVAGALTLGLFVGLFIGGIE